VKNSDIILRGKNFNPEGNLPSKAKSKLHVNEPFAKFRGENDLFFAWGNCPWPPLEFVTACFFVISSSSSTTIISPSLYNVFSFGALFYVAFSVNRLNYMASMIKW
jgi:hypothetical protein